MHEGNEEPLHVLRNVAFTCIHSRDADLIKLPQFSVMDTIRQDLENILRRRLGDDRAKAGVPLAGKQQDLGKYQRKIVKDDLTAAQRIGLSRPIPSAAAPQAPPVQQLWQTPQSLKPVSPTKGPGSSSLYRPKDLYEPLRQLLISPLTTTAGAAPPDPSDEPGQASPTACIGSSDPTSLSRSMTPRRASASMLGGSSAMDAVVESLIGLKPGADPRPGKAASARSAPGPETKNAAGMAGAAEGHCRTLAEDLAYTWQDLQDRFQVLAPHVRQVGPSDARHPP